MNLLSEEASPRKCPNGCGELIEFEKALLIAPTEDGLSAIEQKAQFLDENNNPHYYQAILRACQKCGFYEAIDINEEQFCGQNHAKPKVIP